MAIFGRKRPSMGRVRQQAAPVPVPPPAPAKPAGRAFGNAGKGFGSVSKAPVAQQRAEAAPAVIAPAIPNTSNQAQLATLGQAKKMPQQAQQVSGLKALSPQEYRSAPKQPGMSEDAFAQKQAAGLKQFQGQQAAFNAANMANISRASTTPSTPQQNIAMMQAAKAAVAQQRPNPNMSIPMETMQAAKVAQVPQAPSKAMQSYMAAEKAGTAGNMAKPAFRKGGAVKKKTGYAKGGAVMCGASMPPAQKRKK